MEYGKFKRLSTKKYQLSVEGEVEVLYFNRLEAVINSSEGINKRVKLEAKVCLFPFKYLKKVTIVSDKKTNFYHIFDYESNNQEDVNRFQKIIDEIRVIEKSKSGKYKAVDKYKIGYSNYTFELWILLHKNKQSVSQMDKTKYLEPINRYFDTNYKSMDEFKKDKNCKNALNKICLDDIINAIKRAEEIRTEQKNINRECEYKKFHYFKDNPDLTIHEIVKEVLVDCGLLNL